jgi:hypothetical protein
MDIRRAKDLKFGVTTSIIAAVLFASLIQPFMSLIWRIVTTTAGAFHQGYVDRIYGLAATSDYLTPLITLMVLMFVGGLNLSFVFISYNLDAELAAGYEAYEAFSTFRIISGIHRVLKIVTKVTLLVIMLTVLVAISLLGGVSKISASFNQRLTVLAPAIDDHEYKVFKAQWANMHSKVDYDAIVASVDKRAKELGVSLPPVKKP